MFDKGGRASTMSKGDLLQSALGYLSEFDSILETEYSDLESCADIKSLISAIRTEFGLELKETTTQGKCQS